tara:strand:+ start:17498 stop:18034 length:537 start_codon:yes stop_codon:yes gene_type:complete
MVRISSTNFDEVYPIWANHLWKGRKSGIEPTNPIRFGGGYDKKLLLADPFFFKAVDDRSQRIVGVISGFATHDNGFRLRGVYVDPYYRGLGIANKLTARIIKLGEVMGRDFVWTLARQETMGFYQRLGFEQTSNWINHEVEFGPNCFMSLPLHSERFELVLQYHFWNQSFSGNQSFER